MRATAVGQPPAADRGGGAAGAVLCADRSPCIDYVFRSADATRRCASGSTNRSWRWSPRSIWIATASSMVNLLDPESRLDVPGSGQYAAVRDESGKLLWSSPSLTGTGLELGSTLPVGGVDFRYLTRARWHHRRRAEPRTAVGLRRRRLEEPGIHGGRQHRRRRCAAAVAVPAADGRLVRRAGAGAAGNDGVDDAARARAGAAPGAGDRGGGERRAHRGLGRGLSARARRRDRRDSTRCSSRSAIASRATATRSAIWRTA